MSAMCRAHGCSRERRGYSVFCRSHHKHKARHGHAEQIGVTQAELKPYADEIKAFLDKRPEGAGWGPLRELLRAFIGNLEGERRAMDRGASNKYRRKALDMILAVAGDSAVSGDDVLLTVGGLLLFQKRRPTRFKSDEALRAQVCRRVRGLSSASVRTVSFGKSPASSGRYSPDIAFTTGQVIGQTMVQGLGPVLLYAAEQMDREEAARKQATQQAFTTFTPGFARSMLREHGVTSDNGMDNEATPTLAWGEIGELP